MKLPALGIDIAKLKFDVCLMNTEGKLRHKVFPNTFPGFAQLTIWLTKQGATPRRCMPAWKRPARMVKHSPPTSMQQVTS